MIKKTTLLILTGIIFSSGLYADVFVITTSGLTYTPAVVNAVVGDTVVFQSTPNHPTREVSQATWNANGTALLPGGFDFPSGSGTVILTAAGTRYYVCVSHVNAGMKGQINVSSPSSIGNLITSMAGNGMVYPNPVFNLVNIVAGNGFTYRNAELSIYDVTGKNVYRMNHLTGKYGEIITDISFLRQGVYMAEVKTADLRKTFRVFVSKSEK